MKTVYLDPITFECHPEQNADSTHIPYETDFFDGKCNTFIEGYRYIPAGESWTRSDGQVFHGEMIAPWKPYSELDAAQRQYERALITEYAAALQIVGVTV